MSGAGAFDFYAVQFEIDGKFKLGRTRAGLGALPRRASHGTAAGPARTIGVASRVHGDFESLAFDDLAEHRIGPGRSRKRPYELFVCHPRVARYLTSKAFRELGFVVNERPWLPWKETAEEWQRRIALYLGHTEAGRCAAHNVQEEQRVPRERGGFTFADAVSGLTGFCNRRIYLDRQTSFEFSVRVLTDGERLVSELTRRGKFGGHESYTFYVFQEAMVRANLAPHPKAILSGIPWQKPRTRTGRKPPVAVRRASAVVLDPTLPMFSEDEA